MKKILASLLAITMLMTTMSVAVIPASAEDAAVVATGEFLETFDGYKTGVNWIEHMDTETGIVDATAIGSAKDAWTIIGGDAYSNANGKNTELGNVEVVEYPAGSGNMVLKLDTGTLPTGSWFKVRRNSNGANGLDRETEMNGKKMVIKAKFYYPKDMTFGYSSSGSDVGTFIYDNGEYNFMWNSNYANDGKGHFGSTWNNTSWPIFSCMASYQSNYATKYSIGLEPDTWFDVKYVVDLMDYRTTAHPADTFRTFYDGWIGTATVGQQWTGNPDNVGEVHSKFPQPSTTVGVPGEKMVESFGGYSKLTNTGKTSTSSFEDYYGVSMHVGQGNTQNQYIYMDDVQVYYVDEFKRAGEPTFEKHNNNAWYAGDITIPFTTELADVVKEKFSSAYATAAGKTQTQKTETTYQGNTYKNLFTLKDAEGKVVENGIANASVDGKNLIITPAIAADARNTTYTISASPLFMDKEGQGLNQFSAPTDLVTFTAAEDPYAHIIYDVNFDSYEKGKDWYDYIDTTTGYVKTDVGVEKGAFSVHGSGSYATSQSATVIADPTNSGRGNVMALDIGTAGSNVYSNLRINANGETGILRNAMGTGKKLVYEAKIFFPTGFEGTEVAQFVNPASEDQTYTNSVSGAGITGKGSNFYPIVAGKSGSPLARTRRDADLLQGKWHTIRHIVDVSEAVSATHSDTTRALYDNQLQSAILFESPDYTTNVCTPHGVSERYPATIGVKLIDFYPARADLFKSGGESFGTFFGSHFNLRASSNTASGNSTYYIDDLKAYWIDELTFTTENVTDYQGGKIKLNFNQKINESIDVYDATLEKEAYNAADSKTLALDKLFTIVDSNGNEVSGGITAATTENNGKTVVLIPGALESNKDYKIVISPFFIDEHGQGLENNSTATEVDLHVGEFVPFVLESLSQTAVSGFSQGRDVKITATFTTNVADESITNGIVVTNSKGETVARNAGWTASFGTDELGNADLKTIIFDFGGLPTDSYTVTTNENFLAANEGEFQDTLEIKINAAAQPIVLFNETFDDYKEDGVTPKYTVGDNWIEKGQAGDSSLASGTITYNDNDWHIQSADATAGDFAGVVAVGSLNLGGGFSGNALKLYNTRGASYSSSVFSIRRNLDKLDGISLTTGEYAGKLLVVEMDLSTKTTDGTWENIFMAPSYNKKTIFQYSVANESLIPMIMKSDNIRITQYGYQDATAADKPWNLDLYTSASHKLTQARKFKVVLDQSSEKNHYRMYMDGVLSSVTGGSNVSDRLPGHAMANEDVYDIGGVKYNGTEYRLPDTLNGLWSAVSDRETYIDNFKAYLVDPFEVESVTGYGDVFNTAKATVDFTFSTPVDESTINGNVVVLDAEGNEHAEYIESATLSDGDYKLTVKLSETLPGSTKYTVKLKTGLTDIYGNCISPKYYWYVYTPAEDSGVIKNSDGTATYTYSGPKLTTNADCYLKDYSLKGMKTEVPLTTSKATSLFAEATATNAGGVVTVNATFTNPEAKAMPVWAVVAVYGEYNQMLGCSIANVTTVDAGSTISDTITVSGIESTKVKTVKLHVWDSYEDMIPYHKAETLINNQ